MTAILVYGIALLLALPLVLWLSKQAFFNADGITTRQRCVLDEGGPDQPEGYEEGEHA